MSDKDRFVFQLPPAVPSDYAKHLEWLEATLLQVYYIAPGLVKPAVPSGRGRDSSERIEGGMVQLPEDAQRVLHENRWDLYTDERIEGGDDV